MEKTLEKLGYRRVGPNEYRRSNFHLFIRHKGSRIEVSIHIDLADPVKIHRAVHKGKSIEQELNRILATYRRVS